MTAAGKLFVRLIFLLAYLGSARRSAVESTPVVKSEPWDTVGSLMNRAVWSKLGDDDTEAGGFQDETGRFTLPKNITSATEDMTTQADNSTIPTSSETNPPVTDPPATDPPQTDPPTSSEPPQTDPPATDPPQTEPPTTETTSTTKEPDGGDTSNLAIILGTVIPIVLILIAAAIFVYLKKRPRFKLAEKVSGRGRRRHLSYHPISILEFNSQYNRRIRDGEVEHEFELLQEYSAELYEMKTRNIGHLEVNKPRNRFVDIVPYDDTLVSLGHESGLPPSKYVNASFIQGFGRHDLYIATQGPKRNTVVDFWNMVLEQNCSAIVCLTNLVEGGRVKCFQYWPNVGEMLHFDDLALYTVDEVHTNNGECVIRKIEISLDDDEEPRRTIKQFHLTSWPDHGVPDSPNALLDLCISLNNLSAPKPPMDTGADSFDCPESHILVHCSAGVGRTGTLLAVCFIIREIVEKGAEEIDVAQVVKHLREQRPKMVQSIDQYAFIYTCISAYINERIGQASAIQRMDSSQYSEGQNGCYTNRAVDLQSEESS